MPILTASNLSKSYSGTTVLDSVLFSLEAGEVHALVGENGAGKSTLCRLLCGITEPSGGTMTVDGKAHAPRSRREGEHAGVRMVMQELNLLPTLTVAENIFIDSMPSRLGMIDYRTMNRRAAEATAAIGLRDVAPDRLVSTLGVGQAQLVEIAAALARQCRVLILDEPTAALTTPEIRLLFAQIRRLQQAGIGIIYVSHRMEEIREITNRITILRDGKYIATLPTATTTHEQIVKLMVGRDLPAGAARDRGAKGEVAMSVRNLHRGAMVRGVSFDVHRGEILGFAGLMGSGRTETMRAIFGADKFERGEIFLHGSDKAVKFRSPRQAVRKGIALLTEDRKAQGLLLPHSIRANTTMASLMRVSAGGIFPLRGAETSAARGLADQLKLRRRHLEQPVRELSGGNQQKVVIAKWLMRDCDILIFDEPTRGIDIGAKFEIYELLKNLAQQGKAIIVVSSDLPELLAIADRIAVMSAGRLAATFDRAECSEEAIMTAALSGYGAKENQS